MESLSMPDKEVLFSLVRSYNPEADFASVGKAYDMAKEAHKDQFRASGEPFFLHPYSVACIVAEELHLDSTAVCAALLHDVIEDTAVTAHDIEKAFNSVVSNLVEGVTKLNKVFFTSASAAQAASFRKMIFAMTHDVRVILIKLADRLHNIRTLTFLPPVKQKHIAIETLEIYAPLAHRLGINKIKSELEDVSFSYINPEKYQEIVAFLEKSGIEDQSRLHDAIKLIEEQVKELDLEIDISGRPKQIYSIYNKLLKYNTDLTGLYDYLGVRVLTDSVKDCYAVLGIIHKNWKPIPGRFKDYIAVPKPNMYQSLHTTVLFEGEPLEVQIRTHEMHKVAEEGIAAHWDYKETGGEVTARDYKEKLSWLRNLIDWYKEVKDASEFMETVKLDLFEYHVYVFTPKGEVVELPKDSTPIDFAYSIHTMVGHTCVGAKVNGRIVPLDYRLQNGDIVSILTSKKQKGPSRDWLNIAGSASAKRKIRNWLKKEFRDDYIVTGEKEFLDYYRKSDGDKELEKTFKTSAFAEKVKAAGYGSLEEIYASLGSGDLKVQHVFAKLFPELLVKKAPDKLKKKPRASRGPSIIVDGLEDALAKISKCCNPIPGDRIVGYITRGRGVTIHKDDCENLLNLRENEADRLIEAKWDTGVADNVASSDAYNVRIRVEAINRKGMLNSLTALISGSEIDINSVDARVKKDQTAFCDFSLSVSNLDVLEDLMNSISRISGVLKVYRT